jgi:MATE family multidrug resistance protein
VEIPRQRISAELRAQVNLAVPLALVHGGYAVMGLVDTAVVGRLTATDIAAVGLGNAVYMGGYILCMGIMMGFDPLMAQAVGAQQGHRARALVWQGFWLALVLSSVVSIPLFFAGDALTPLGMEAETSLKTAAYIRWRLPGLLPALTFVALRSFLQATTHTRPLVWSMVGANVLNLLLTVLLVHGGSTLPEWTGTLRQIPSLGVTGAALATTACTAFQLVVVGVAILRQGRHDGAPATWMPVLDDLWRAVRVGTPLGLQMGAEMGVFSLVGILAGRLGTQALAAHQVAIQVASLSFCVALGASSAGSVRVAHAVGAEQPSEVRLRGLMAFSFGAGFMVLMAVLLLLFPHGIARAFTTDAGVIAQCVTLLGVAAVFQLADGVQAVGAGVLRGAGDTRFLGGANIVGHYVVGVPVALFLAFRLDLGITGLWWGLCAGLFAVAGALLTRFLWISGRPIVPLAQEHGAPTAGLHALE